MKSPFPGMDPYLEHPSLWSDVHTRLMTSLADEISKQVTPNYYVSVETHTYIIKPDQDVRGRRPDLTVISPNPLPASAKATSLVVPKDGVFEVELPLEESLYYLEIRAAQTHEVITSIEILSPVNKVNKDGRRQYEEKRDELFGTLTNLVEIDLLRAGRPMPVDKDVIDSDYRILIRRGWSPRYGHLYAFNIRAAIPDIPVPLTSEDDEPTISLNQILHDLYQRARYDLRLDYSQPAEPPLAEDDAEWARTLLSDNDTSFE
ncbi:MAG: DUF4058 family protein [Chloroflexota bacterium]